MQIAIDKRIYDVVLAACLLREKVARVSGRAARRFQARPTRRSSALRNFISSMQERKTSHIIY